MRANKTATIDGQKVEEFYWNGQRVCYVDNMRVSTHFAKTCEMLRAGEKPLYREETRRKT